MTEKRCDQCLYWEVDYRDEDMADDDKRGSCHRHAPRPTAGGFERELIKHITTISWDFADEKTKDEDFDTWEEAHLTPSAWPSTYGHDWCGEFVLGTPEAETEE